MPPALPVVRVVGESRSGKTPVAERIVEILTQRGYLVAALKHSHHDLPPDAPRSDTARLAAAGAGSTCLAAVGGSWMRVPQSWTLRDALDQLTGNADVLIVEGFKNHHLGPEVRVDPVMRRALLVGPDGTVLDVDSDHPDLLVDAIERRFHLSAAGDDRLRTALRRAAAFHGHLCPGQVLGVRMALAGLDALGLDEPDPHRLHVTVEIDRCATDAISAVTRCTPGKRSLRILDLGKMAATFLDTETGTALRIVAREDSRAHAAEWAPSGLEPRHEQATAYRTMPADALFEIRPVLMDTLPRERPPRQVCQRCDETVNFGRVVQRDGHTLCLPCATGQTYYQTLVPQSASTVLDAMEISS